MREAGALSMVGMLFAFGLAGHAAAQSLALPLNPACISSPFGPRSAPGPRGSQNHLGIDIPAPAGAWVRAVAAGRVTAIRRRGAAGLEVEIRHADGRVVRYAHLGSVAPKLANGGRQVAVGERIGRVGRTGTTYGTHLHLEVLEGGRHRDAAPLLGLQPCAPRTADSAAISGRQASGGRDRD